MQKLLGTYPVRVKKRKIGVEIGKPQVNSK